MLRIASYDPASVTLSFSLPFRAGGALARFKVGELAMAALRLDILLPWPLFNVVDGLEGESTKRVFSDVGLLGRDGCFGGGEVMLVLSPLWASVRRNSTHNREKDYEQRTCQFADTQGGKTERQTSDSSD
jgi:hypothetical protein